MSKVAIVTDSTATIPKEYVEKYNISVAPQVLIWGEKIYEDGVDIQPEEFYTRLKNATVMPSTSQATPAAFHKIFSKLLEEGYEILAILLSQELSGTIPSAVQAKEMLPGITVEIVDSRTIAMALGFLVLEAARAVEAGASLAEAKALAESGIQNTGVVFAVDTLEFLHRGGRIGGGTRFLGTALNLKPILEVREGKVEAIERVRTRSKSLNRLLELTQERIGDRKPVHLAALHANAEEDARELLARANGMFDNVKESLFSEVSPVIGTHAGPGTVGLVFLAGM
jgi:DegV family protein with EDD domain